MTTDPVVSPADTPAVRIRRDASHLLRSVVTYGGVKEIVGDDLYRRSLLALRSLETTPDELLTERARLLAVGEQDRRQIARLTEALEAADVAINWHKERIVPTADVPNEALAYERAEQLLAAVLAGEEDAANG